MDIVNMDKAIGLAKAIRQQETGGTPKKGATGELYSMYQFTPGTWARYSKEILGNEAAPLTRENENKVASLKIKQWLDAGYSNEQVAAMWNGGEGAANDWQKRVGVNEKYGVKYDVPAYVRSVTSIYNSNFNNENFSDKVDEKRRTGISDTDILNKLSEKNPWASNIIGKLRTQGQNDRDVLNNLSLSYSGRMPTVASNPTAEQLAEQQKSQPEIDRQNKIKEIDEKIKSTTTTSFPEQNDGESWSDYNKRLVSMGLPKRGLFDAPMNYEKKIKAQLEKEKNKLLTPKEALDQFYKKEGEKDANIGGAKAVISLPINLATSMLAPMIDVPKNIAANFGVNIPGTEELYKKFSQTGIGKVFTPQNEEEAKEYEETIQKMIILAPEISQLSSVSSQALNFAKQKKYYNAAGEYVQNQQSKAGAYDLGGAKTTGAKTETPKSAPAYSTKMQKADTILANELTKGFKSKDPIQMQKDIQNISRFIDNKTATEIIASEDPYKSFMNWTEKGASEGAQLSEHLAQTYGKDVTVDFGKIAPVLEKKITTSPFYTRLEVTDPEAAAQALEIIKTFSEQGSKTASETLALIKAFNAKLGGFYDKSAISQSQALKSKLGDLVDVAVADFMRKELYPAMDKVTDGAFSRIRNVESSFQNVKKQLNNKYTTNLKKQIDLDSKAPGRVKVAGKEVFESVKKFNIFNPYSYLDLAASPVKAGVKAATYKKPITALNESLVNSMRNYQKAKREINLDDFIGNINIKGEAKGSTAGKSTKTKPTQDTEDQASLQKVIQAAKNATKENKYTATTIKNHPYFNVLKKIGYSDTEILKIATIKNYVPKLSAGQKIDMLDKRDVKLLKSGEVAITNEKKTFDEVLGRIEEDIDNRALSQIKDPEEWVKAYSKRHDMPIKYEGDIDLEGYKELKTDIENILKGDWVEKGIEVKDKVKVDTIFGEMTGKVTGFIPKEITEDLDISTYVYIKLDKNTNNIKELKLGSDEEFKNLVTEIKSSRTAAEYKTKTVKENLKKKLDEEKTVSYATYPELYRGSSGEVKKYKDVKFDRILVEPENQFALLKKLKDDGVNVPDIKTNEWRKADEFLAKYYKDQGYDAIQYNNTERLKNLNEKYIEVFNIETGEFMSNNKALAEVYSKQRYGNTEKPEYMQPKEPKVTENKTDDKFVKQDIGEKFGGAKKDLAALRNKFDELSLPEQYKYITKDKVLTKFEPTDSLMDYIKKEVFAAIPTRPADKMEVRKAFIDLFPKWSDEIINAKTIDEIKIANNGLIKELSTIPDTKISAKNDFSARFANMLRGRTSDYYDWFNVKSADWKVAQEKAKLPATERKTKERITRSKLIEIVREGGKDIGNVEANYLIDQLGHRGVEYGNWVKDTEAKQSIVNYANAMTDLGDVLGVSIAKLNKDMDLGIAFGSRGSGNAMAHYEPAKRVINLTRTKGDGSVAHEWSHALDHLFAEQNGGKAIFSTSGKTKDPIVGMVFKDIAKSILEGGDLENIKLDSKAMPESLYKQIDRYAVGKIKDNPMETYNNLQEAFGNQLSKGRLQQYILQKFKLDELTFPVGKSKIYESSLAQSKYWASVEELFARSFENYVKDKGLEKGIKNNYLVNVPASELWFLSEADKKVIYPKFDKLFERIANMQK